MALIKCTECGKEFSDKAGACPNCGCPTEIVKEELDDVKEIKQVKIVNEYNIAGYQFVVDEEIDFYIRQRKKFQDKRENVVSFAEDVYCQYGDIDTVIEEFPECFSVVLEGMIELAVKMLISYGIYDCDKSYFYKKYSEVLDASTIMEPIIEKYLEIQGFEEAAKQYRDYIKYQRSNAWRGGGFGVSGAIKGHIKAQMMNAGNVFLHKISDDAAHSKNMSKVADAKKALYKDERTKNAIKIAITKVYDNCNNAVMNELIESGIVRKLIFNEEKADRVLANIMNRLDESDVNEIKKQCLVAFQYDPASQKVIDYMLTVFKEDGNDLEKYAREYGFYNKYFAKTQLLLMEMYPSEMKAIKKLCDCNVCSNNNFFRVIEIASDLKNKGIVTEPFVVRAADKRIEFGLTYDEKKEIGERILLYKERGKLTGEILSYIQKELEKCEVDYFDRRALIDVVKKISEDYSNRHKDEISDIRFSNRKNFYEIDNYKNYMEYANVPSNSEVFVFHGRYDYTEKKPKYVIFVTDSGVYAFFSKENSVIEKSWKNIVKDELTVGADSFESGRDIFEKSNIVLYSIVSSIRKNLMKYWNEEEEKIEETENKEDITYNVEGVEYKTEEEALLAKEELKYISDISGDYKINHHDRFLKILCYEYKTKQADKKAQEYLAERYKYFNIAINPKAHIHNDVSFLGTIILMIVFVGLGLWMWSSQWVLIKIIGGLVLLYFGIGGIGVLVDEIGKKKRAKRAAEEYSYSLRQIDKKCEVIKGRFVLRR